MILVLVIGVASAAVFVWSVLKQEEISNALIDFSPLEFQEGMIWRTAFHEFALSPSAPLNLQAGYVRSSTGICFVTLGISLCCFLLDKVIAGWVVLILFFGFSALTIKAWKTYQANRRRRMIRDDKEES